ncbi:MAG: NAD(P)-binding domain-containing protein [Pseudomonadota bacterium]|nr:NAD(P)-binding domain-containing protein [Pseudomonadota bacterium]
MKLGIIGAGAVGQACLLATVLRGPASEIVVVDRTAKRADGLVTDIQYGAALSPSVTLRAGDYDALAGAALVMVTAGENEKSGGATDRNDPEGRLKLLDKNAEIYRDIVARIVRAVPEAIILVVTDPPDPLAQIARKIAGHDRVLSTGTYLDSLRFRFHLARQLGVNPGAIEGQVVGEHGTSSVFLWSHATVAGLPVFHVLDRAGQSEEQVRQSIEKQVRGANITIIEGIGASQLGIGMVCARLAEIIARDEQAVIPIGAFNPEYGVVLSLPSVLGRAGVSRILSPEMTQEERQALGKSAEQIRRALHRVGA